MFKRATTELFQPMRSYINVRCRVPLCSLQEIPWHADIMLCVQKIWFADTTVNRLRKLNNLPFGRHLFGS